MSVSLRWLSYIAEGALSCPSRHPILREFDLVLLLSEVAKSASSSSSYDKSTRPRGSFVLIRFYPCFHKGLDCILSQLWIGRPSSLTHCRSVVESEPYPTDNGLRFLPCGSPNLQTLLPLGTAINRGPPTSFLARVVV